MKINTVQRGLTHARRCFNGFRNINYEKEIYETDTTGILPMKQILKQRDVKQYVQVTEHINGRAGIPTLAVKSPEPGSYLLHITPSASSTQTLPDIRYNPCWDP